ncbi:MAG: DUF6444 domain-containing protein, partial [Microcystis sp.]
QLEQHLKELQDSKEELSEKVNRNSENSHSPPAADAPNVEKTKKKKPTGKKRGGQPGHPGHSRPLYAVEECTRVTDHYPQACTCCGEKLTGVDPKPYRHQVVKLPPIQLQIEEHRLHQLTCTHCGEKNRAGLPKDVERSGYGERVVAIVSVLSGMYRHSHRMVVCAMSDLFGVRMSLGTVNRLRKQGSESLSALCSRSRSLHPSRADSGSRRDGFCTRKCR